MPLVNFYRGSYSGDQLLLLCQTAGNIVFDNNTNRIYAGTYTDGQTTKPKPYGSNVTNATFTNNTLTITTLDSADPISLNFGDVASASQTMAVFTQLEGIMGALNSGKTAPDYSTDQSGILHKTGQGETDVDSLVAADLALAAAVANAGQVDDVQVNGTTIVSNKVANLAVEGTYNASTNKVATQSTVSDAIGALDVNTDKGAASVSGSAITINAVQQENGLIKDGGSTTINLEGTYNESTNKIATQSTVSDAIGALDVNTDKGGASISGSTITINAVQQENGLIKDGGSTTINLDGTYDATNNKIATESTVENVIADLDSIADADTASGTGYATVTTTTPTGDFKVLNSVTETDGKLTAAEAYNVKKVAATAEASDLYKSTNSTATYDTAASEISNTWKTVVNSNALADGDTVDADLNKLDTKIAGLADEVIANEQTTATALNAISDSVGLENDFSLDLSDATGIIGSDTDVKSALVGLADTIVGMDGTATIASKSGDAITLKAGIAQTNGEIANNSSADITLADVAATGAAENVSIADSGNHFTATDVESALAELATTVEGLSGSFDVIKATNAANTPYGVTWDNAGTTVTGTLVASADTFHKVYLVPASGGSAPNSYDEYITTKDSSTTPVTYGWEKLGSISVDLTGYAKSVTVNGKQYSTPNNSTDVNIGDVITSITGENAITTGADSDLVSVEATTVKDTTNGTNVTTLASKVKVEDVADGLTKDATATYAADHYVIENGKLVSAAGKSTGDTYTLSANDGLTKASDVKAYVDSSIQNAQLTWAEWN